MAFSLGGTVQKLTYPAGSGPICTGKKGKNTSAKNRQPGEQKNFKLGLSNKTKLAMILEDISLLSICEQNIHKHAIKKTHITYYVKF